SVPLRSVVRRLVLLFTATVCIQMTAVGQADGTPGKDLAEAQQLTAAAIQEWMDDFSRGRIGPRGALRTGARLQPRYMAHAKRAGHLRDKDLDRLNHLDALQKLLFFAEKNPSPELGEAVLSVASAGLDRSFLDRDAFELREAGHWTLMRMENQGIWFQLLRAAAGERVPVFDQLRTREKKEEEVSVGPARRVAALRLLGQRGLPVFRSTLEAALIDQDPRVRLAAAESIRPPWKAATVKRVGFAMQRDRHPVVSQALVRLLFQMLKRPPRDLTPEVRESVVSGAFAQMGLAGWRTDMDLLDLVEAYPHKSAIPKLIEALDLNIKSPDALVSAVNNQASPLLRQRAGQLLRAMTGALVPIEDPDAWRAFWAKEQNNIVVPERLAKADPNGTTVKFFGVPVTGTSIAFLIDTSGSMDSAPAGKGPTTGLRRTRVARTRLEAAKEQLVLAAQVMAPASQYYLLTFADKAKTWTRQPIRPDRGSTRSLTGLLSRLNARGGTNLYAGLIAALETEGRTYGDKALPKIDELFLLSDGDPTSGDVRDTESICEMVKLANRYAKIRINTVFTGSGKGAALLRRLADENGGVFVQR
ncbi:MAG: hypothetical protein ACI8UD_004311, partial [Planctomycetota bacterium]